MHSGSSLPRIPPVPVLELPPPPYPGDANCVEPSLPTNPTYVEGIPPDRGQAALRQMSDVESIHIPVALRATDIRGKEVIFYEITAASFSHVWVVYKRFSDFYDFHIVCKEQLCVEHDNFLKLPELPSRLPTRTDAGIDARRAQLADYLSSFLARAQEAERQSRLSSSSPLSTRGPHCRVESRLAALVHHFVCFIRSHTPLFLMVDQSIVHNSATENATHLPARVGSARQPIKEGDDIPPVRITRHGDKAFVATLHVPGVAAKDLYVVMNAEQPRHIIIGGRWNNFSAASIINQKIEELTQGSGGAEPPQRPELYFDTLPVGDFEITFEVPEPFEVSAWFSEMKDGVFHVVWSTVL